MRRRLVIEFEVQLPEDAGALFDSVSEHIDCNFDGHHTMSLEMPTREWQKTKPPVKKLTRKKRSKR